MKTTIIMIFTGTVLVTGSVIMGSVLGSVEFRGTEWKIMHLCLMAFIGGTLIGSTSVAAMSHDSGTKYPAIPEEIEKGER